MAYNVIFVTSQFNIITYRVIGRGCVWPARLVRDNIIKIVSARHFDLARFQSADHSARALYQRWAYNYYFNVNSISVRTRPPSHAAAVYTRSHVFHRNITILFRVMKYHIIRVIGALKGPGLDRRRSSRHAASAKPTVAVMTYENMILCTISSRKHVA